MKNRTSRTTKPRLGKPRRFRGLLWKLTRSYLLVTLVSVLLVELLVAGLWWLAASRPAPAPAQLARDLQALTPQLRAPLSAPTNAENLTRALAEVRGDERFRDERFSLVLSRSDGRVLACAPENWLATNTQLPNREFAFLRAGFAAAQRGETRPERLGARDAEGATFAVVPVESDTRGVAALLWVRARGPLRSSEWSRAISATVLWSAVIVGFFGTFAGLSFGWVNARRLTGRLKNISDAADAWSRGDFAALARDNSDDEIGELAGRLNLMASQLQELVALRERATASDERDRFARDLHDTVKQQLFATTMQVGAARVLLERDPALSLARLTEAERLAFGAQRELTALLEQLRPGSYLHASDGLSERVQPTASLDTVLRAYLRDWDGSTGIATELHADVLPPLPAATQQALLRIAQEALANAARHSHAARVTLQLRVENDWLAMTIQDNGQGFAPETVASGMGLHIMRERAQAMPDGSFALHSAPGVGARIEVRVRVAPVTVFPAHKEAARG